MVPGTSASHAPPARSREGLLAHARALVGARLADLADDLGMPVPVGGVRSKGWSGQIIERELGGGEQTGRGPDFADLGVELKTVPVDARLVPLESTCICQIDPVAILDESWARSAVRHKLSTVLWVALEVPAAARANVASARHVGDRRVAAVRLWSPSAAEDEALRQDFELFVERYFRPGRAEQITGHVGALMQVRPKGRNARDTRLAPGPAGELVRVGKCGFYLRPGFVGELLAAGAR